VLPLRFNQTVDLVLQNAPALNGVEEQHPWHLHGDTFFVIAYGLGDWPGAAAAATSASASPPRKDTVTLPPGGWVWLRLRADNAGAWPLHCHISWHQYMGMLLVLLVAPELVAPP
jgi:L-ascorbate oxidase